MTFEEIRRISDTAPEFDKLWIAGGEPFLRKDLAEIIEMFHRRNGVKAINLPTNGLLPDRVERIVGRLLDSCPRMTIHLNFSLDGLGKTHDEVRRVPGNFEKTVSAMERIERAYGGHPRLHRNVATVVTPLAYEGLYDLGAYLFQKFNLATHYFETVRGEPRDPELEPLDRARLEALHERLMPLYEGMADRLFGEMRPGVRQFAKLYFVGMIRFLYGIQLQNLEGPRDWGMSCTAGQTTFVIDHDGGFRACEMRPRIGHMRDFDFDLGAALRSTRMRDEIETIGGGARANCWCTHTCWMLASLKFSPRTLIYRIPRAYLDYMRGGSRPFDPSLHGLQDIEQRLEQART
jgi:MoaA/NifB/PqqE/SkfB family radical SAM enzyme